MKKSLFVANSMTISGVVLAIIGVIAIVCGEDFFEHLLQIAGAAIALMSLFMLVMRIVKRKDGDTKLEKTLTIVMFAFAIIGGILLFYFAEQLTRVFAIILGIIILLFAVGMLIVTVLYREKKSKLSLVFMISSIVVLITVAVLGYLFIKDPDFGNKVMAIALGILMILLGLVILVESFMVRKSVKLLNENLLDNGQNAEVETVEAEAEIVEEGETTVE